jgi:hypothetical protein
MIEVKDRAFANVDEEANVLLTPREGTLAR